jgi:hypothetical protein
MDATPTASLATFGERATAAPGGCAFICPLIKYLHSRRKPSGAGLSVRSIVNFERRR